MDRLLNVQTALSLGYVAFMAGSAYVASRIFLPSATTSAKTRAIFLWLAFDAICHFSLEGSFLYLSVQGRTVNASPSFFGYLWQEYSAADARWGVADPTVVALEFLTVLGAGPLAAYCCYLLAKQDPVYHYWAVVLSTAELYGGFMTFAPEWLTGSPNLDTSNWLFTWVYLAFMNLMWVFIPLWLMIDSFGFVALALRAQFPAAEGVSASKSPRKPTARANATKAVRNSLTTPHGIGGTAYTILLAALFFYIMPTASAANTPTYDHSATVTLLPRSDETLVDSLSALIKPLLLPAALLTMSVTIGAIQVAEKGLRKVKRSNKSRRKTVLAQLGIDEKEEIRQNLGPRTILGFFHPYCNAGGGGERVLYEAIAYHQRQDPRVVVVVYTGDVPLSSKEEILTKASQRFGITIDGNSLAFIPLKRRWMVEQDTWKTWTLFGQSYGSVWLGFEAMACLIPDVFVDTMGYAFTYPVARLFDRKLPVGAYVHYPIISTDMIARVGRRESGHTNTAAAKSRVRTWVKLTYYRILARLYAWALGRADVLVVNGTWTRDHINHLLGLARHPSTLPESDRSADTGSDSNTRPKKKADGRASVEIVYPPCDTSRMSAFPLTPRRRTIVSLAQFRPEKEHTTQIYILQRLLERRPDLFQSTPDSESVQLIMMGSSRNDQDTKRIELLRILAQQLGLDKHITFIVNADFDVVLSNLAHASVGLSTMKDEHFGINVVEFMAAGLVTLSHRSAGPFLDIAVPTPAGKDGNEVQITGLHADSIDDFAASLEKIFDMPNDQQLQIRQAARARAVHVFGTDGFTTAWDNLLWQPLRNKLLAKRGPMPGSTNHAKTE
ncbi:EBP-domain-containing protein [Testicularia cyperi]|uniref:GDP-Man:Man(3)GlcNAc(2)-PP-Dol alpha-1,2-mannosyltransferase n=1 Tax=Testicularia cyperi TaxID=1882483 RepID=A0A317XPM4_9BASI|nr:EBP-domain-containing protein [Testicularia cyperi]